MAHILFSGAAGYIGSCSAYYFLKNTDAKITIVDNLSSGFLENVAFLEGAFSGRVAFVKLDLADSAALRALFEEEKFDCVAHFAASLIVPESVTRPLLYYANNTKNTLALISLCVEFGVPKFIFSSTAAVYGEPKNVPVSEDSALLPINPYGSSKMMSELILRDCAAAHAGFNYVALRYFNVAGALSYNDYAAKRGLGQRAKNATHLIKVASECAVGKRARVNLFGEDYATKDGSCVRDYIHIDDLAAAHLAAFDYLGARAKSEVFNVGYGQGYSVKEVLAMVKKVSGVDFEVVIAPRREGDAASLVADNAKILRLTNWKPRFNDLAAIAESALSWEKII